MNISSVIVTVILVAAAIVLTIAVVRLSRQVRDLGSDLRYLRERCSTITSLAHESEIDVSECKGRISALSEAVEDIIRNEGERRYVRAG